MVIETEKQNGTCNRIHLDRRRLLWTVHGVQSDRLTFARAMRRIDLQVRSHPVLANYKINGRMVTRTQGFIVFSFNGTERTKRWLLEHCLLFLKKQNKAELRVLMKLIYYTHLNNWHPHMGNQEVKVLGELALTSIHCQRIHGTLMKRHLTLPAKGHA